MAFPSDFSEPWAKSDLVLHAENSDGKPLHANKTILATYSTYFHGMFFGGFVETSMGEVPVPFDYDVMLQILRIIHDIKDYSPGGEAVFEPEMLEKMYIAADFFDCPFIRNLCLDHFRHTHSEKGLKLLLCLGHYDEFFRVGRSMNYHGSDIFYTHLCNANRTPVFSKSDIPVFYKAYYSKRHTWCKEQKEFPSSEKMEKRLFDLQDIAREPKNLRFDLTRKWQMSDVVLLTNNSWGHDLHTNKAILSMVSPYFRSLFSEEKVEALENEEESLHVDVEFVTMRQILWIVHHCYIPDDFDQFPIIYPVILYDMHLSASEDHLDIPLIQSFVVDRLCSSRLYKTIDALEVAAKIGLSDEKISTILQGIGGDEDFMGWVNGNELAYLRNGEEVNLTSPKNRKLLSLDSFIRYFVQFDKLDANELFGQYAPHEEEEW